MSRITLSRGPRNLITDVDGIRVGNAHDTKIRTGVTVVLPEPEAVAAVDVRGGGPGTRETDALDPTSLVNVAHAIVLSGGSVYGLDAASGVVNWLGARGCGFKLGNAALVAPIVPSAILFDLSNGGDKTWGDEPPYRALGVKACEMANVDFKLGNSGAGFGAIAGHYKGGLGSASVVRSDGLQLGALVAANPFGSVIMPGEASFWAAPCEIGAEFGARAWPKQLGSQAPREPLAGSKVDRAGLSPAGNTTIGVVAINWDLTRVEAQRIAIMAQDGYARAIQPVHTPFDGDTIFVLATGRLKLGREDRAVAIAEAGALAADCMARAVARGVYEAETLGDAIAYRERHGA